MGRAWCVDRYAARCANSLFVVTRMAVLGARSAPGDTGNQPRALSGYRKWSPWLVPVLILALVPMNVSAQGKSGKAKHGGPAFCRSGAGHPVFGWEWCRDRGWGNAGTTRSNRTVRRDQGEAYPDRDRNRRINDAAFDNGYADGYEKGLDDARDGRTADPTRHGWYRSADRNYDPQYGSRAQYANIYRDGFRSGYEAGFADGERYGGDRNRRFPWPF